MSENKNVEPNNPEQLGYDPELGPEDASRTQETEIQPEQDTYAPQEHEEHEVAVWGIRGSLARIRAKRARNIIEKMDHKDAFYADRAESAQSRATLTTTHNKEMVKKPTVKPRSLSERFMDIRTERKTRNARDRFIYDWRAAKIYGKDTAEQIPSVRQSVVERATGLIPDAEKDKENRVRPSFKLWSERERKDIPLDDMSEKNKEEFKDFLSVTAAQGVHEKAYRKDAPNRGVWHSIKDNAKRVILGAGIDGYSKWSRLWYSVFDEDKKTKLFAPGPVLKFIKGEQSALKTREDIRKIKARPVKLGGKLMKSTRRKNRKAQERLVNATEQPILSKWRNMRRERAKKRLAKIEGGDDNISRLESELQDHATRVQAALKLSALALGEELGEDIRQGSVELRERAAQIAGTYGKIAYDRIMPGPNIRAAAQEAIEQWNRRQQKKNQAKDNQEDEKES